MDITGTYNVVTTDTMTRERYRYELTRGRININGRVTIILSIWRYVELGEELVHTTELGIIENLVEVGKLLQ